MSIERHLVGAGGLCDCVDADGPDPVPIKQLGRYRQQTGAGRNSRIFSNAYGRPDGHGKFSLDRGVTGQ